MKKALYIGGFCMPDGNAAAQRVLGIAKALRINDYDVRFCGLSRKGADEGSVDGFSYKNYDYPKTKMQWLRYLTGRDYAISEIDIYNPDVVILYNHPAFAIEHIAKYCHKKGIKVIGDITEWYEPQGGAIFRAIKGFDTNRRMHRSHLMLDGLICISTYLTDYYKGKGVRIVEVPPLVDIEQAKWHQNITPSKNEIHIVYAGSPGALKDRLDLILQAFDEIIPEIDNKLKFDVIGITAEQYSRRWQDHTKRGYVTFKGRLPHTDVVKTLLEADFQIFLRPDNLTNRAGFPTKFVETITSRTLPITNLSSNLQQYLSDGINGFVIESLDKESIKKSLSKALNMSKQEIDNLKGELDNATFDYHKFSQPINDFLLAL